MSGPAKKTAKKRAAKKKALKRKGSKSKSNIQRELFPAKYVELKFNGAAAAVACGYAPKGAPQQASRLLSSVNVQVEIAELVDAMRKSSEHSAERVLEEIRAIAFFDPLDLYDDDGEVLPLKDMPERARRVIASLSMAKGVTMKETLRTIKLCSKERALEMLAKYEKLYSDAPVQQHSGDVIYKMVLHKNDTKS